MYKPFNYLTNVPLIDANGNTIVDGFFVYDSSIVTSIVTGNGFEGYAQRIANIPATYFHPRFYTIQTLGFGLTNNITYGLAFRYRLSAYITTNAGECNFLKAGSLSQDLVDNLPINTGDAILKIIDFVCEDEDSDQLRFYLTHLTTPNTNDYLEIEPLWIREKI